MTALDQGPPEAYTDALRLMRLQLYPEAVPGLLRMLQSGTDQGRWAAAELLGWIGDRAAVSPLTSAAVTDRNEIVRVLARNALKKLDNTPAG